MNSKKNILGNSNLHSANHCLQTDNRKTIKILKGSINANQKSKSNSKSQSKGKSLKWYKQRKKKEKKQKQDEVVKLKNVEKSKVKKDRGQKQQKNNILKKSRGLKIKKIQIVKNNGTQPYSVRQLRNHQSMNEYIKKQKFDKKLKNNKSPKIIKKSVSIPNMNIQKSKSDQFSKQSELKFKTLQKIRQTIGSLKFISQNDSSSRNQQNTKNDELYRLLELEKQNNRKREQQLKNLSGKQAKRLQKIHMIERDNMRKWIQSLRKNNEQQPSKQYFTILEEQIVN